jgi:Putative  PD-(D/E)XK family member, (DUF4420)
MDLYELYQASVDPLPTPSGSSYAAVPIPDAPMHSLGKDPSGAPCVLIRTAQGGPLSAPTVLRNLTVVHDVYCRIVRPDGSDAFGTFTIITCSPTDPTLFPHFLRVVSPVLTLLGEAPASNAIRDAIAALVDVFRSLSGPGKRTVQGLWAEMFVIYNASDTKRAAYAWRSLPGERADFALGDQRLEVKSSASRTRQHEFSQEQLTPPRSIELIVASIHAERMGAGLSVRELYDAIRKVIAADAALALQFDAGFYSTLGSQWSDSMDEAFDPDLARESLRFYRVSDIPKISSPIPNEISGIQFRADLSNCHTLSIAALRERGGLFAAIAP